MAIGQALLIKPPKLKVPQQHPRQEQAVQKTNKATIIQGQPLQFEQSLELVQTLLGASIGCLSFLRGLLPEECFVEKRYGGKSSAAISYRSFTSDLDDESFKKMTTSSGTRVKRLRRGYSGEADQLLDWLEIGIFDALKKGYLKAVQLAIYVDKQHPDIIVESYTFSFSYREKGDGTSTISLRVTDITGCGVTIEDANKNLQLMMRRLIVITQNLPPLPDQRWLTIRLHYLDHTPSDYDPPSFTRVSASSPSLKFRENETTEVEKLDVGCMDAGFHAVSLKISSTNEADGPERPRRRRGSRFVHADMDIDIPQFTPDASRPTTATYTNGTKELPKEPTMSERANPAEISQVVGKRSTVNNQTNHKIMPPANHHTTQRAGRNTREKFLLRGMLRPVAREGDLIATQPLSIPHTNGDNSQTMPSSYESSLTPPPMPQVISSRRHPTPTFASIPKVTHVQPNLVQQQASIAPKERAPQDPAPATHTPQRQSPRNKNAINQGSVTITEIPLTRVENAIESVGKNMAKLKLSKAKTIELRNRGKIFNSGSSARKNRVVEKGTGNKGYEDHINCECGDDKFEEDVICCDNCDEWQHTDCYGFTSAKDIRIPDYHVCYSCLLGKNEGKLLEEMRNMALFRKALRIIWNQGSFPSSNKVFANKLGCDLPTALQITGRLESEGFISNDAVKSKLHKKRVYKIVKTEETKRLVDREYFDPLKKISHHFENPTSPNIIRESLLQETPLLARPPQGTVPSSFMDTVVGDSQEVGNVTEEAIFLSRPKDLAHIADADAESTADEEDNTTAQENRLSIIGSREAVMDRFRSTNRFNIASLSYSNLKTRRHPFEIVESPDPIEIDVVEESQVPIGLDMLVQATVAGHDQSRSMNVSGVLQDIFVGEELGYRNCERPRS